jgi:hypothetical protein
MLHQDVGIRGKRVPELVEKVIDAAQVAGKRAGGIDRGRGYVEGAELRDRQRDGPGFHKAHDFIHAFLLEVGRNAPPALDVDLAGEFEAASPAFGPGDQTMSNQLAADELDERTFARDGALQKSAARGDVPDPDRRLNTVAEKRRREIDTRSRRTPRVFDGALG